MNIARLKVAATLFWRQLKPTLRNPRQFMGLMRRVFDMLKKRGLLGALKHHAPPDDPYLDYGQWLTNFDTPAPPTSASTTATVLSVLVLADALEEAELQSLVASLIAQSSSAWELLIGSTGRPLSLPPNARIRHIAVEPGAEHTQLNTLFDAARGQFVLHACNFLLHPQAVAWIAAASLGTGADSPRFIYWDHDCFDASGKRCNPDFKPDWNPAMLNACNYLHAAYAVAATHLRSVGGYGESDVAGSGWDLALRATEMLDNGSLETATSTIHGRQIVHIATVLTHHWVTATRSASQPIFGTAQGVRLVEAHLLRLNRHAVVSAARDMVRVEYVLPDKVPQVSIVIPTRDGLALLRQAVDSIRAKTDYADYEIIIVDNQSQQADTKAYLRALEDGGIATIVHYDAPFNYSAINNAAVRHASGEILCLLNNDIEVISPHWLTEMVGHALQPDTGAVGAMLYFPDERIQHAGVVLGLGGYAKHVFAHQPRFGLEQRPGPIWRTRCTQNYSAVTAACLVLRKAVFDEVGGFDEQFVIEMNDVDLCLRIEQRGYRNLWTPHVELYHHESASRGYDHSAERRARAEAEAKRFAKRWGILLTQDPCYNRNLALDRSPFMLAWPPR